MYSISFIIRVLTIEYHTYAVVTIKFNEETLTTVGIRKKEVLLVIC